jgi:hypothetical protein
MRKLLYYNDKKFKNIDELMSSLYPFFKTRKLLKRHTELSSIFYSSKPGYNYKQDYTYVWDKKNSMDNILRGWIPKDLFDIILANMKSPSKKFVKELIFKWMGKVNDLFFNFIWKNRNSDMMLWEERHNIKKLDKKHKKKQFYSKSGLDKDNKKPESTISRKNNRERKRRGMSGKKKNTVHYIDELLYSSIKILIFGYDFKFTLE